MEKILNTDGLGVSGRQNELIELALTFKFDSVAVDMVDLLGRHDTMGKEFACQFLESAKTNIGMFDLPLHLDAPEDVFKAECKKLDTIFTLCETLGGKRCRIGIEATSDESFQENFEMHRTRLSDLGDKFAEKGMKIGLDFAQNTRSPKANKFIQTAEELLSLVKTVGHSNVGLHLDTWKWKVAGGGMDQISADLTVDKVVALAMADVSSDADPGNMKPGDRTIPQADSGSFSLDVFKHLKTQGYEGPISFATHMSTFANQNRDKIVERISKTLDCLIAGESLETLNPQATASEDAEKTEGDSGEKDGAENTDKPETATAAKE